MSGYKCCEDCWFYDDEQDYCIKHYVPTRATDHCDEFEHRDATGEKDG